VGSATCSRSALLAVEGTAREQVIEEQARRREVKSGLKRRLGLQWRRIEGHSAARHATASSMSAPVPWAPCGLVTTVV
jgi:glycogen synthase